MRLTTLQEMRRIEYLCPLGTSHSNGEYGFPTVRREVFVSHLTRELKRHPILGVENVRNALGTTASEMRIEKSNACIRVFVCFTEQESD